MYGEITISVLFVALFAQYFQMNGQPIVIVI